MTYKDNGAYSFSTGEIGDPFAIGSWPITKKKLNKFSRIETQVVALSVDSEEDAQKPVKRNGLKFPVL